MSRKTGNTAAINQFTFNEPTTGLNNALTIATGLTPVASGLIATNLEYFTNLENSSSGLFTGAGAAYSLAYSQYNTSTDTFTINYDIFSPLGATTDSSNPDLALDSSGQIVAVADGNISSIAVAPAWYFRSAGSTVLSGSNAAIFGSAIADDNGTASAYIQFQTYREGTTSTTGLPSFQIHPVLTAYASGATDAITVESAPTNSHTVSPNSLLFTPNSGSGTGWSFAWDDTVTDTNGTHNQVEFALYTASGTLVSQSEFQIADGNVQNVEVSASTVNGASAEILVYSDDTGTNVVVFNSSGTEVASLFNSQTAEVNHVALLGDGRIALTYDVPDLAVDASGNTTQFVTDIYDLRTSGLSVNDSSATVTSDQYFAGTQYGDTIVGANNVSNTYDFVGDNTSGTGPAYSFTGGTASWNVVILPDTPSQYSIDMAPGSGGGSGTVTETGDSTHAGTLTLTGVQALAFSPTVDPSGNPGSLYAAGAGLFVYGLPGGGEPITIENGSTLQLALTTTDNSTVTFTGGTGSLVLNDPGSFTGQIIGFTGTAPDATHSDTVDLIGIDFNSAHFAETFNSATGLLSITDGTHSADITFGDFNATLDFASDSNGGTLITDPPATGTAAETTNASADTGMTFNHDRIDLGDSTPDSQPGSAEGAKPPMVLQHDGDDTFVFHHELGAESPPAPQADNHEANNYPDAQLTHELTSLITPDPHAQAVFEGIHNDMLAPMGLTPVQIHQAAQAGHFLH